MFIRVYPWLKLAGSVRPQNDAGGKQRKTDYRQKENHVARVENAFFKAVEMRDDAERRDSVHKPIIVREIVEQIDDWWKSGEDQKQTGDDRHDEAHHLAACDGRRDAAHREIRAGHQPTADVSGQNNAVVRAAKVIYRQHN